MLGELFCITLFILKTNNSLLKIAFTKGAYKTNLKLWLPIK